MKVSVSLPMRPEKTPALPGKILRPRLARGMILRRFFGEDSNSQCPYLAAPHVLVSPRRESVIPEIAADAN
jgi:hypothetical protein